MTPKQLRQKASENIASAKTLLENGHHDNASYIAGYAVEFVLKARYCARKGWADFPEDRTEARRRAAEKLMIHDLEELLKLSDGTSLQTCSFHTIEWDRAMDWSSEQRYEPTGKVTRERAEKQIQETEKLCLELALFEIVDKLVIVEMEASQSIGEFNLFILADRITQEQGWELLISGWWTAPEAASAVTEIRNRIMAIMDEDLCAMISRFSFAPPHDGLVQRFHCFPRAIRAAWYLTKNNIMDGWIMPNAFVITNFPRSMPMTLAQKTG